MSGASINFGNSACGWDGAVLSRPIVYRVVSIQWEEQGAPRSGESFWREWSHGVLNADVITNFMGGTCKPCDAQPRCAPGAIISSAAMRYEINEWRKQFLEAQQDEVALSRLSRLHVRDARTSRYGAGTIDSLFTRYPASGHHFFPIP